MQYDNAAYLKGSTSAPDMALPGDDYRYAQVPQQDNGLAGPGATPAFILEQESARRAAATLFVILGNNNPCRVETGSVYGPAIVMPQFARSTGYHKRVTELAMRSLLFVAVNIAVQGWILFMFSKEQMVMDKFAGKMALCDFGGSIEECPDATGCIGPGGTVYAPPRLYPFAQWTSRNFVKDSLKALFPERADDIERTIDPGEYGVESTLCRLLCCFLFMMAVTKDAFQIYELWRLLWNVPSFPESWISYENYAGLLEPELSEHRTLSLCQVKLRIAGMPMNWKIFNVIFILLPKMLFWVMTADLGIAFLMNTSGITDSIVNSMALAFILSIDELIFETATAGRTKYMMDNTEPYHPHKLAAEKCAPEEHILCEDERHRRSMFCPDLFPQRLLFVVVLTWIFLSVYYYTRCEQAPDGTWVSRPLHLPKSMHFSALTAYLPIFFDLPVEEEPVWTMPTVTQSP